jgi:ribosomal peptide maturation radical SAM protein 1
MPKMSPRVLLCYLPYGPLDLPYLGIGLLKAALKGAGIDCDVGYFAMDFARRVGVESYRFLSNPPTYVILLGEWSFAGARDGSTPLQPAAQDPFLRWLYRQFSRQVIDEHLALCQNHRQQAEAFLDGCLEAVDWSAYDIAGFSVGLEQLNASLALAKRLKQRYPHLSMLFGGQGCFLPKGAELLRCFPFIDHVCLGEGEEFLPEYVRRLRSSQSLDDLPGLAYRRDGRVVANPPRPVQDLDSLPPPDYDDFIQQYQSAFGRKWRGMLYFESSRGCAWGTKTKCTFCGLPFTPPRQKAAQKVVAELDHLARRYDPELLEATDSLAPSNLDALLKGLENRQPPLKLAYCLRADVNKSTLERLQQKGLHYVNVGIESLSTSILRLMRKGTAALDNLQVMKWCRELGIRLTWGLMYGIPGEDPAEYKRMANLVPLVSHLAPPYSISRVNLFRESPYFNTPEAFGITNVRPSEPYRYLLPGFSEQSLWNLAYFYDYDFADGRDIKAYLAPLWKALGNWIKDAPTSILAYVDDGDCLRVFDTRQIARRESFTLSGMERQLYLACDEAQFQGRLCQQFASSTSGEIGAVLDRLVEEGLMVSEGQRYLSLAVDLGRSLPLEARCHVPDSFWLALGIGLYCTRAAVEKKVKECIPSKRL